MACLLCAKSVEELCRKHKLLYKYEPRWGFYRRKRRVPKGAKKEHIYKSEGKLFDTVCGIFGKRHTFSGVRPRWAVGAKGVLLEYDIAVPIASLLIEYNGLQHYEYVPKFHHSRCEFREQKERDGLKAEMASRNGYRLVTISYRDDLSEQNVRRLLNVSNSIK